MGNNGLQIEVSGLTEYFDRAIGDSESDLRRTLLEIVINAGHQIMQSVGQAPQIKEKGAKDFATQTDISIENAILDSIRSQFPTHDLVGEETGSGGGSPYQWVVDPIDGTFNFVQGIPFFAVSVGLLHLGRPILAAVYDPARRELFFAQKGRGAWLGRDAIGVSTKRRLLDSALGLDLYYDDKTAEDNLDMMKRLVASVRTQRILGCAALGIAYVSCGRLDGYYHNHILPWDVAAGQLLVEEANGCVTDFSGRPFKPLDNDRTIVATNGLIHDELLARLVPPAI